jgi:predicted permease
VDLGFDASRLLHARVPLPRAQYADAADRHRFFREVLGRLQHVPGVVAVATGSGLPPFGAPRAEVDVPGSTHGEKWRALVELASEGYADVLGLGVRQGRFLSEADVRAARRVAVVNETFVRSYLGAHAPLGRAVVVQMPGGGPDAPSPNPSFEIVGVVGDAKNAGLQEPVAPEVYLPYTVTGAIDRHLLVRTAGPPEPMLEAVKREVWAVDRGVALTFAGSLRDALRDFAFAEPRLIVVILGVFAGVGLVLVALGVFSVIAYTVSGQTHEIGIRMALGAARADILGMVLGLGLKLVGMGAALGVVASLGLTRVLSSHLYGVTPSDPGTFAAVLGVIALAGACASYLPALRATRVAPVVALRGE